MKNCERCHGAGGLDDRGDAFDTPGSTGILVVECRDCQGTGLVPIRKGDSVEGSGAFEPETESSVEKTYEVVGPRIFRGWEPGDQFSEPMTESEEARAIARGDIRVVGEGIIEENLDDDLDGNNNGADEDAGKE